MLFKKVPLAISCSNGPEQNGLHFADDIMQMHFFNEKLYILI